MGEEESVIADREPEERAIATRCFVCGSGGRRKSAQVGGLLQKTYKLVNANPRLPNDSSQSPSVQHLMIWDDQLSEGFVSTKDDMTTRLSLLVEPH